MVGKLRPVIQCRRGEIMNFCNECGSLLYPKQSTTAGKLEFQCRMCGNIEIKSRISKEDNILHVDFNKKNQKVWFVKE